MSDYNKQENKTQLLGFIQYSSNFGEGEVATLEDRADLQKCIELV